MLRTELGEELFWNSIHTFVRQNAHKTVETIDLLRAIEQATGRNYLPLFDQYVFRGGHPEYKLEYSWDGDNSLAKISVAQTQEELFDLKIPIAFIGVGEDVEDLDVFKLPDYVAKMESNNWLGDKSKQGFYKKTKNEKGETEILSLDAVEIDSRFPIQEVSTGVPFIIVPLKTHAALKRIKVNQEKYWQLIEKTDAKSILAFCPETYNQENQLSVRVFADYFGVPEDPATGSANGCLAGYLVEYSYFGSSKIDVRVEQGHEIGRPSLLLLSSEKKDAAIEVKVGGKVIMVAKGEFV